MVDEELESADIEVARITQRLGEKTREKEAAEKEERYQFEVKLQQMKIDSQSVQAQKYDKNAENAKSETGTIQAKLPKIEIEKFNGSPLDWPRFWNQFSETVDKRSVVFWIP